MRRKLPSKKPWLLQTDVVGAPGSSVALRPTTDINAGKCPWKKVLRGANAGRNESPHSLIRRTSLMQANRTLDQKVGLSVIVFASSVQSGFLPPKRATVDRNRSRTDPHIAGTKLDHLGPVYFGPWDRFKPIQTGFLR
jgi:hypothetical protein